MPLLIGRTSSIRRFKQKRIDTLHDITNVYRKVLPSTFIWTSAQIVYEQNSTKLGGVFGLISHTIAPQAQAVIRLYEGHDSTSIG